MTNSLKPVLVYFSWPEDDAGSYMSTVLMTDEQADDLRARLEKTDVYDLYVGPENTEPATYESLLEDIGYLFEDADED